jgi:signal peptidase I
MYKQKPLPALSELEEELNRLLHRKKYRQTLRGTVYILITVAAVAILIATLLFPVLHLSGSSMDPTLKDEEFVLAVKTSAFKEGDVIAFYYNNKILVKRVIGVAGDIISIKSDGTVFVNGAEIDESYITDKSLGECDIEMPYQVPESRIFVMGDHRKTSLDSRSKAIGSIETEKVVGKIVFRIWPISEWGKV